MNALCVLTHHDGTKTVISLKGKEYHANKLQYVLSRIADRSVYKSVDVLEVDPLTAQLALKVDALEVL